MTKSSLLLSVGAVFFILTGLLWAQETAPVIITMDVPPSAGVNVVVSSVVENPTTHVIISSTPVIGTALTFSDMSYDQTNHIWTPPNYFSFDIANTGAGSPHVTVVYADGGKPTGQTQGLGYRATVVFRKVTWINASLNAETPIAGHDKKALISVNDDFLPALTTGGWFKMYIGIATDSTTTNASPFTNRDIPGTYTGTLTVTATSS